ncbi:MAG TPA: glycoside hydrolase family 43 protein [Flavisolibacter sp.]|nr:glycoside hydrolase family 43 protein [Flavisolibacter sp.]
MKITVRLLLILAIFLNACTATKNRINETGALKDFSISNPVLDNDFPDPTVIKVGNRYYAYATQGRVNGKMLNIQVASSPDLQHWEIEGDALPQKPKWANTNFWAPHVLYDKGLKKYVMFYSGESIAGDMGKCLGVAFSDKPQGPFIDKGTPLLCGQGFVNIDPMALIDPQTGKKILYWGSGFQPIKVQEMADDWSGFKAGSIAKAVVFPGSEKKYTSLIEGAWVDIHDGQYYLYYSGDNCCGDKANYAVMVARSDHWFGPFQRYGEATGSGSSVILEKDSTWLAPGHNSIIKDDNGKIYIAYHAIKRSNRKLEKAIEGDRDDRRVMCIRPLEYKNGWPVIE